MELSVLVIILAVSSALFAVIIILLILQNRRFFNVRMVSNTVQLLFDNSSDGIIMLDEEGKIQEWNPAMEHISGYSLNDVKDKTIWEIQSLMYLPQEMKEDDRHSLMDIIHKGELVSNKSILEYKILRPDGEKRILQELVFPVRTDGRYWLGSIVRDITDWADSHADLAEIALKDELTSLYNRRGFLLLGDFKLKRSQAHDVNMAIIYVDMDGMKAINDKFGHEEGDVALRALAFNLKHCFRDDDIVARIGGDEFVVLAEIQSQKQISIMEARLRQLLDLHNSDNGKDYDIRISMGYVLSEKKDQTKLSELLKIADERMYEQKKSRAGAPQE